MRTRILGIFLISGLLLGAYATAVLIMSGDG